MEQQEPNPPCAGFTLEGEFLIFPDFPFTGRTRNWVQRCHWPGWATWIEGKVGSRLDFVFPWVFPLCHPGFPLWMWNMEVATKRKHQNPPGKAGGGFGMEGMLCVPLLQREILRKNMDSWRGLG